MKIETDTSIYPLTIIKDRYNGVYSGGKYLAFNLDFDEIPTEVIDNDVTTSNFFYKTDLIYGKGEDIASALLDLDKKIGGET